ncbi:hypothetical protein SKAU_G00059790 [Synaphobranchus kaupii]|uniref:Uncharacterized protein n=1 Tax=Synaphobranchus kaupii TaxID=118154 RepID=A0A9Q1G5R3_SYNKA|nr:hypothetical protein SKAU_G00059790 [Synaphobranchus kaupii]
MELVIFSLIRAFREANFTLYCQALSELIPYFFANNNVNYARWLPVHLRDMLSLHQIHPELALEFHNGKFVVHKSSREFSAMAIDQAHEQANALIKGDGGAVGVTEDPSALRRWMVAGPEVSHLVAQYEAASEAKDASKHIRHHEQTEQVQRVFFEKADRLYKAMNDMGNPFQEETGDLLTLDTKDIAHSSAAEMVGTHYEKGRIKFQEFMKDLESKEKCTFYEPIKRNKMDFFRQELDFGDPKQKELGLEKLWIAFGQGGNLRWIPIHELSLSVGPEKIRGILFFHAFTGCDVVSAFRGKGKKSAWQTWDVCTEASDVFMKLSKYPPTVEDGDLQVLEKFVITMYDRSSTAAGIDDARLDMFARKQKPYEAIPPTRAALIQHAKRAAYQAGCIWGQATVCQMETKSPANWGWTKQGDL